jgi:hypothetical protein
MAKLTISDAARACRIARSTLQRAINAGRLSLDPDHRIDTAELLRAGYTLHAARQEDDRRVHHGALQDAAPRSTSTRQDAAGPAQREATPIPSLMAALERENALLRAALDAAAARELDARADAQSAREERARLLQMLQDMQQRYDRLLDMPRPAPPPPPPAQPQQPRTPDPRPAGPPGDARGAMRRRILALLRDHPEGLTPTEVRKLLGVKKRLADTLIGMLHYGMVRRVGEGRYVVA